MLLNSELKGKAQRNDKKLVLYIFRFRSITKQYFRKADGVIVMFDLCSERSFKNMRNWMNSVEVCPGPN